MKKFVITTLIAIVSAVGMPLAVSGASSNSLGSSTGYYTNGSRYKKKRKPEKTTSGSVCAATHFESKFEAELSSRSPVSGCRHELQKQQPSKSLVLQKTQECFQYRDRNRFGCIDRRRHWRQKRRAYRCRHRSWRKHCLYVQDKAQEKTL